MVLAELVTYLATAGIGTAATDLFYGIMPETPDACVALFEYPGLATEPTLGSNTVRLEFPSVQVIARGVKDDYDTPRQKAEDVVTALVKIFNQTLTSTKYLAVIPKNSVSFLDRDENFRVLFKVDFQVYKTPS